MTPLDILIDAVMDERPIFAVLDTERDSDCGAPYRSIAAATFVILDDGEAG